MLHLRIGEHFVHLVDRSARHACVIQQVDPCGRRPLAGDRADRLIQPRAILRAIRVGGEIRISRQLRRIEHLAEPLVDRLPGSTDIHVAVGCLEHASRDAGRVIIAGLSWHLTAYRPTRRLEVQHGDLCREQIALHPLALAGLLTLQQGHQNAHCTEDAGGEVGDRNADAHGPLSRKSGDRHQTAHALRDLVEAGTFAIRPVLAEARNAGIHQPWIDRPQVCIVDAEAEFHIRAVILHQHVGVAHQALQNCHALRGLQIERHAAFVAV